MLLNSTGTGKREQKIVIEIVSQDTGSKISLEFVRLGFGQAITPVPEQVFSFAGVAHSLRA